MVIVIGVLIPIVLIFIPSVSKVNTVVLIVISELITVLNILLTLIVLNNYIGRYMNNRSANKKDTGGKNLLT